MKFYFFHQIRGLLVRLRNKLDFVLDIRGREEIEVRLFQGVSILFSLKVVKEEKLFYIFVYGWFEVIVFMDICFMEIKAVKWIS